uniref:Uncharacterized protein n=1 Tax=Oryza glaberrima TaxID=4538 RepID=I1QEI5_ORYGL
DDGGDRRRRRIRARHRRRRRRRNHPRAAGARSCRWLQREVPRRELLRRRRSRLASRRDAFDNDDEVDDAVANASEGSGDADNDEEVEMVLVEDEQGGGGDHRWQQHVVGVLCSVGLTAATAAGLALLLGCGGGGGGGRPKPAVAVNFRASANYKVQMRSSYHESSMTVTKLRAFDNVIR